MQFFTGVSGQISSLNYPNGLLDELAYTICLRREAGYCGAEYSLNISPTDAFYLDADTTTSYTLNPVSKEAENILLLINVK